MQFQQLLAVFAQIVVLIASQVIEIQYNIYSEVQDNKFCNNPLPGVERMLLGVDITKLDLKHDYSVDHVDGFTDKVLDLSCSEGKIWISPFSGAHYDLPDQVNQVLSLPAGIAYSQTQLDTNLEELRQSMSAEAGIDSAKNGLFSASLSYIHSQSTLLNTSRYSASLKAFASTTEIKLIPSRGLLNQSSLNRYILQAIEDLPDKYADDPKQYEDFITTYGTHYYSSGYFGGTLMIDLEIDKSYYKATSDTEVKANAEATFFGLLKAHGAYDGNVSQVSEAFKSASSSTQRYYGGVANLFDKEGYSKWWPTVAANPWLYGGKLTPLTDLLPTGVKKQSLVEAVDVYILKAYLREIERTAESFMGKNHIGEVVVSDFLQQAEILLNSSSPTEKAVTKLGEAINDYIFTPEWFSKLVYCVIWTNPYKGFVNKQCAFMLSPTPAWYMCDGDYAEKDCYRSITFEFPASAIAPSWWSNVTAVSNAGDARQFTFRVPQLSSPGWLLNVQLCFYRFGAPYCAKANQWTPDTQIVDKHVIAYFNFLEMN